MVHVSLAGCYFKMLIFNLQGDFKSKGEFLVYPIYKQNFVGFSVKFYIF